MAKKAQLSDIQEIDRMYQFPEGECIVLSRDAGVGPFEDDKLRVFRVKTSTDIEELKLTSVGETYAGTPTRFSTDEGVLHIPYAGKNSISGVATWIAEPSDQPIRRDETGKIITDAPVTKLKYESLDQMDVEMDGLGVALDNLIKSGKRRSEGGTWADTSSGKDGWKRS